MIQDIPLTRGMCFFVTDSIAEDKDCKGVSIISGPVAVIYTVGVVAQSKSR
jgi:hypothetical protein